MRRITASITALLMTLSLTACNKEQIPAATLGGSDTTTLQVVTSYGGDDGNHKKFTSAVEAFQTQTGISVEDFSATSNEEWKNEVLTDFMTGSEPDVLFYFVSADAAPFVNADKVVSVEEIREVYPDYASNMKEEMFAQAEDGKHYAVPSTGYWENLFVNKKVLNACGLEIPGPDYTWDQFLEDCQTIRDEGYTPIACSLIEIPHYWFEFTVLNHGSVDSHLEVPTLNENGELEDNLVSRRWISALEDIKYLYEEGYFSENTLTATDAQTVAQFADGKAAFLLDGSWKVGYLSENYPDKMGNYVLSYVPGLGAREATQTIGGISMGYFITRRAWENPAKREAAVKFVSHMTSDETLSTFVTTEITALIKGAHPEGLNTLQQSAADTNGYITAYVGAVQDTISSEAKADLFSNVHKVVTGKMSSKAAVESAIQLN